MTGGEINISELADFICGLYSQGVRLEGQGKGTSLVGAIFMKNWDECLTLLTNSLRYNGPESLDELDKTPLDLVYVIHKGSAHGGYLPLSMVGALIFVKKFLSMARSHPAPPPVVGLNRSSL